LPNHRTILGGSRNSPWHPNPIIDCTVYIYIYVLVLAGPELWALCVVESPPYNSLVLAIWKIGSTPLHPFAYHTPFILTMEVPFPQLFYLNLSHLLILIVEVSQPSILCIYPTPFILTMEVSQPSNLYISHLLIPIMEVSLPSFLYLYYPLTPTTKVPCPSNLYLSFPFHTDIT